MRRRKIAHSPQLLHFAEQPARVSRPLHSATFPPIRRRTQGFLSAGRNLCRHLPVGTVPVVSASMTTLTETVRQRESNPQHPPQMLRPLMSVALPPASGARVAGVERIELPTRGFGDRSSTTELYTYRSRPSQ